MSAFLKLPTEPFRVSPGLPAHELLARMERISFQGRNLAAAHRIWCRMLEEHGVTILLGAAGALSAGGLRLTLAHLVAERFVDCVVSTGANLYHDLHETRGRRHYMGCATASDRELRAQGIDRVYDTYAREAEFVENDEWIAEFACGLEPRAYTSREFLYRLGAYLWRETQGDGLLTAAYRAKVPIYCPAIADSSIGMALAQARHSRPGAGQIDVVADIIELSNVVLASDGTASVVLGGGTPKNFINQAVVEAEYHRPGVKGHAYAVQIVADPPHFGGASGASLEEAQSWGKVATDAAQVTVMADVTIALPLLASAIAASAGGLVGDRPRASFELARRTLLRDGRVLPHDRFAPDS